MNKTLPLLLFLATLTLIFESNISAQTTIKYNYDAAGNREKRYIITLPANTPETKDQESKQEMFEENLGKQKIVIYPNPTHGQLLVEVQGYDAQMKGSLELYNLSGTLLISTKPANAKTPLDLSAFPVGTYVLKITLNDKVRKWKIVKE